LAKSAFGTKQRRIKSTATVREPISDSSEATDCPIPIHRDDPTACLSQMRLLAQCILCTNRESKAWEENAIGLAERVRDLDACLTEGNALPKGWDGPYYTEPERHAKKR
jgi:hypothetical protein